MTNDFLPFANDASAGVETQSDYLAALTSGYVRTGFTTGTASSTQVNKALRQGTVMASALASFIVNVLNQNVLDGGGSSSITALAGQILSAVKGAVQGGAGNYAADTGTTNAMVAMLSPAPTALTTGMVVIVKSATTNTGAVTLNLNALGAKSVVLPGGDALTAGTLLANQMIVLVYNGTAWEFACDPAHGILPAIQSGAANYAADTGSANALVATLAPVPAALATGMTISIKAAATNTGATTINVNGLGVKSVVFPGGDALPSGAIVSGQMVALVYNGTAWELASEPAHGVPAAAASLKDLGNVTAESGVVEPAGLTFRQVNSNGYPATYGNALSLGGSGSSGGGNQLLLGWSGVTGQAGDNFVRSRRDVVTTWSDWERLLTESSTTVPFVTDTGSANALVATYSPAVTVYRTGMVITVTAAASNTGAATINVNGLGTKSIVRSDGAALRAGDIRSGQTVHLDYNGTNFRIVGLVASQTPSLASAAGLTIKNNTGTPNTQVDWSVASAILVDPSTGAPQWTGAASGTINLGTTGAGALDTGSIANSTWYFLFIISNGATVTGLASTSATSPTLPSGYTWVMRVGAVRTNSAGVLYRTMQKGRRAQYTLVASTNTATYPQIAAPGMGAYSSPITLAAAQVTGNGYVLPTTAVELCGSTLAAQGGCAAAEPTNVQSSVAQWWEMPIYVGNSSSNGVNMPFNFLLESNSIYVLTYGSYSQVECLGWVDAVNAS
jgi:hypothetical protein